MYADNADDGGDYNNDDSDEVQVFADSSRGKNCWNTLRILFKHEIEVFGDSSRERNYWVTPRILFRK